jgi:hypothetical protein
LYFRQEHGKIQQERQSLNDATFNYIMVTWFSGGRSWSTRREPPTMGKQLVNFITCRCESSVPFLISKIKCPELYWMLLKLLKYQY